MRDFIAVVDNCGCRYLLRVDRIREVIAVDDDDALPEGSGAIIFMDTGAEVVTSTTFDELEAMLCPTSQVQP